MLSKGKRGKLDGLQRAETVEHSLLSYYLRGLIPGPDESKESFLHRVGQSPHQTRCAAIIEEIYGCAPDWIHIAHSPKGLLPWEAACTRIEDGKVEVQLHPKRKKSEHQQILAHEAVHAIRCAFDEPRFEEILAYRTSSNVFRRYFGPLFQKPWQAKLLLFAVLIDSVSIFFAGACFYATLLIFSVLSLRLMVGQHRFASCRKNLNDPRLALALTDSEILELSRGKKFMDLDDGSLRWEAIKSFAAWQRVSKGRCGI